MGRAHIVVYKFGEAHSMGLSKKNRFFFKYYDETFAYKNSTFSQINSHVPLAEFGSLRYEVFRNAGRDANWFGGTLDIFLNDPKYLAV